MGSKGRILVVDDDPMLREVLGEVLADEGHDVRLAPNGREALEHLDGWEADLVILDLMMPVMDGYAFRAAQRERDRSAQAPVLVISAAPDAEIAAASLDAASWLAKPFGLDQILDQVDALLEREPAAAGDP